MSAQLTGQLPPPHPLDPLSSSEIKEAVAIVRKEYNDVFFNAVTLWEPRKKEMMAWLASPETVQRPHRVADIVAIGRGSKVFDGTVDLEEKKVLSWDLTEGVQPLKVVRTDPKVIEQCGIIGIPPQDMHKVYCDPWTIGYDERFGSNVRLQQALMYYRPHPDDSQYTYPLDFCPIFNADTQEIIHIDIPKVRRQLNQAPPSNFHGEAIEKEIGLRTDVKPIEITQPQGVSFEMDGRTIKWQNWSVHIGFNYREGLVLSNISFNDRGNVRPYGAGYMTNSLSLGCDCKGAIHYMDAEFVNRAGDAQTIKNAICIHEEDAGILFKHTDFRDESCTVTRGRKLIISQIFTAANYEYCVYWIFMQDGTIQLEIKLTGILNTYALNPGESAAPWGTEVYPGVNAHNTIFQADAVRGDGETALATPATGMSDYDGNTSRTWDMANTSKINPYSKKPVSYKLVSREVPPLLPKENSLVWKRAGFARHAVHVTKYSDDQIHPAGRHVPQTSGEPSQGIPAWISAEPEANLEQEDVVLWHTFGLTHFPAPEDYPIMPAEPMTVLLRPRNFFTQNPCMDVPPSYSSTPTQMAAGKSGIKGVVDNISRLAFGEKTKAGSNDCCGK
ncbi:unnamed protein product [Aureobasidium pullulans]|nr:unnamed protein product [Aureobasidium pullulans]